MHMWRNVGVGAVWRNKCTTPTTQVNEFTQRRNLERDQLEVAEYLNDILRTNAFMRRTDKNDPWIHLSSAGILEKISWVDAGDGIRVENTSATRRCILLHGNKNIDSSKLRLKHSTRLCRTRHLLEYIRRRRRISWAVLIA